VRHTDEVQIDRSYQKAVQIIARLQLEKAALRDENISLKNRPETVYDDPQRKSFRLPVEPAKKDRIDLTVPISKWNIHHFVRYFQVLYEKMYGTSYKIRGEQWKACCYRLSEFRKHHDEVKSNTDYKNFVDWLFENKFNPRFQASIPLISHLEMLQQWIAFNAGTPSANFDDLIAKLPTGDETAEELLKGAFQC